MHILNLLAQGTEVSPLFPLVTLFPVVQAAPLQRRTALFCLWNERCDLSVISAFGNFPQCTDSIHHAYRLGVRRCSRSLKLYTRYFAATKQDGFIFNKNMIFLTYPSVVLCLNLTRPDAQCCQDIKLKTKPIQQGKLLTYL